VRERERGMCVRVTLFARNATTTIVTNVDEMRRGANGETAVVRRRRSPPGDSKSGFHERSRHWTFRAKAVFPARACAVFREHFGFGRRAGRTRAP